MRFATIDQVVIELTTFALMNGLPSRWIINNADPTISDTMYSVYLRKYQMVEWVADCVDHEVADSLANVLSLKYHAPLLDKTRSKK